MLSENNVCVLYTNSVAYNDRNAEYWFRPDRHYPEVQNKELSKANSIYDGVREAFIRLEMDKEKIGTSEWNPLGELIHPGNNVLIKPNLVMDYNQSGEGTECLFTQPDVVAPVIDYVLIALRGQGKITIGDAPMQECILENLLEESGFNAMLSYYKNMGVDIEVVDFRGLTTSIEGKKRKGVRKQSIKDNPEGTIVDLKNYSEFAKYDQTHLEKMRITNYSPDRLREHHMPGKHEYYVSNYVLNADAVINIPKPKTHRKAGYTAAMKNMVGINVRKEFLPHHTIGSKAEGGDEYKNRSLLRKIDDALYDLKNTFEGREEYKKAKIVWYLAGGLKVLGNKIHKDEAEGNWYGNQTISKTIVDLNKILLYANKQGVMCNKKQREVLHIGDMIISGEKEGPVAPSPKKVGVIVVALSAYAFDVTVGTLMGAKTETFPFLIDAKQANEKYKVDVYMPFDIVIQSNNQSIDKINLCEIKDSDKWFFLPTRGWRDCFFMKR